MLGDQKKCMAHIPRSSLLWRLSVSYMAGAVGGVANAAAAMILYYVGFNDLVGCTWDPVPYTPGWLYNKMVWGGFWATLHIIPFRRPHWLLRGVLYGLLASTVHLTVFMPAQAGGMFGVATGKLTFIVVYITDGCWALASATWYHFVAESAHKSHTKEKSYSVDSGRSELGLNDLNQPLTYQY